MGKKLVIVLSNTSQKGKPFFFFLKYIFIYYIYINVYFNVYLNVYFSVYFNVYLNAFNRNNNQGEVNLKSSILKYIV